jgi:methionyl-tRNA formyltransferase
MHCGPLPQIRGMNGVEWALFFGFRPTVTLHYIDKGIDTGPIVAERTLEVKQGESLGRIRARTVLAGVDLLLDRLEAVASDRAACRPNPGGQGRQYFVMSPILKKTVQNWIDRGLTPFLSATEVDWSDLRPAPERQIGRPRP